MVYPVCWLKNMTETNDMHLVIDPTIRNWVFIPIVIITFAVGLLRYYCVALLVSGDKQDLQQITDGHAMMRARLLIKNGKYLPRDSFLMRKDFFVNEETGCLTKIIKSQQLGNVQMTMMQSFQTRMIELLPMVVVGSFIEKLLSGFVVAKIPFPVTLNFKKLLQPEIHVKAIDTCWISSLAWYVLNLVGLNSMCKLVCGENMDTDANELDIVNNPMSFNDVREELINFEYTNYLHQSYDDFKQEILEVKFDSTHAEEKRKKKKPNLKTPRS
ncbi:ER membrane protein complex subunit 3-like [Teleopsis dalmanni]|uniref:ER membrane protein complex subunit 3-like n=1 Tax=Teleopsis dalmanni TaxID=139649 RepID=UPI000D32B08C|nr:ER membrane protein complex subunit 3-like [Teleopsis dalmanni]